MLNILRYILYLIGILFSLLGVMLLVISAVEGYYLSIILPLTISSIGIMFISAAYESRSELTKEKIRTVCIVFSILLYFFMIRINEFMHENFTHIIDSNNNWKLLSDFFPVIFTCLVYKLLLHIFLKNKLDEKNGSLS